MLRPRIRSGLLAGGLLVAAATAGGCARSRTPAAPSTLRVLSPSLPESLDPTRDSRLGSRNVFFNVFDPLVRVNSAGQLVPAIAESWTNPSAEVYEFRIRAGVRFHGGATLEPADVVASLERARAPDSVLAGNLADVLEVRVAGPRSVALHLRVPTAILLHSLTAIPILKPGKQDTLPDGTGPYEVAEFRPAELVRLRRFAGYYDKPPLLDSVTFRRFRSGEEVLAALREPEPTLVFDPSKAAAAAAREDARLRVASEPSGLLVYLAFDLARSPTPGVKLPVNPFRDVRVRRAFRYALDLEALIRDASSAGGIPATQLAPPGVFGFDPLLRATPRDLPRARALLKDAGFPDGFEVVLDVRQNDRPLGEALGRQLKELGIRVGVNPLAGEDFTRKIEGDSSIYAYNWILGQESGEALKNFFHTKDPRRGLGLKNRIGYSNPRVDQALEVATATQDEEARLKALNLVMRLLMEDLPWVPLFADKTTRVYPRNLFFPARTDGMLVLREARVEAGSSP